MLDKKIALIGCVCGLVLMLYAIVIGKGIGLTFTLFFGCLVYLIVRLKGVDEGELHSYDTGKSKLYAVHTANILCLVMLLVASVFFLSYSRPLEYFLLSSFLSAVIGLEILTFPDDNRKFLLASILLQILLLSASLRWGVIFEFPGLIRSDPWYHSVLTEYIVNNGRVISPLYQMPWTPIQIAGLYAYYPFTQIIVATTGLITSIPSYKVSSVCSIGIFEIVSLLFIFLMSRKILADVRLALFATLFVGVSNWHIVAGFALVPQSLGYGLFALMIFLLVKQVSAPTRSNLLLISLTLFSAILSHTLTSFVLIFTIASFFLSKPFFSQLARALKEPAIVRQEIGVTLPIALFSGIAVLTYWVFYTGFFAERISSFVLALRTTSGIASPFFKSYLHYEFDQSGIYLLYILAIVGCLVWLRQREKSIVKISIITSACAIFLVIYGSWFLGVGTLLPERWFVFGFILIASPAAEGLKSLVKTVNRKRMLVLTSLLIFSLTFLMITTGDANMDNPLFGKNEVAVPSYTESEMQGANTLCHFFKGQVYSDTDFSDYFHWFLQRNMSYIDFDVFEPPTQGIIIERSIVYERPVHLRPFGPYGRVNRTFEDTLQMMNRIYCNGEIAAYSPRG